MTNTNEQCFSVFFSSAKEMLQKTLMMCKIKKKNGPVLMSVIMATCLFVCF